jgi:hypothetical protein
VKAGRSDEEDSGIKDQCVGGSDEGLWEDQGVRYAGGCVTDAECEGGE